jgi:predicted HD superfamily hydrolase involved in NAD metabolism
VAPVTYAAAEELLAERLSPGAFAHSRGVGGTAAVLAARFDVDVDHARLGGLLHDWDRERTHEELLGDAARCGLDITAADKAVPYLLHARTGAASLRATFPELPEEVISAVAHHTVGSAEMSPLDKVVYIADMIEPRRDYPGVDGLRALATTAGLDELFAAAYQQSVTYLIANRKRIHPDTVAVWNALVAGEMR